MSTSLKRAAAAAAVADKLQKQKEASEKEEKRLQQLDFEQNLKIAKWLNNQSSWVEELRKKQYQEQEDLMLDEPRISTRRRKYLGPTQKQIFYQTSKNNNNNNNNNDSPSSQHLENNSFAFPNNSNSNNNNNSFANSDVILNNNNSFSTSSPSGLVTSPASSPSPTTNAAGTAGRRAASAKSVKSGVSVTSGGSEFSSRGINRAFQTGIRYRAASPENDENENENNNNSKGRKRTSPLRKREKSSSSSSSPKNHHQPPVVGTSAGVLMRPFELFPSRYVGKRFQDPKNDDHEKKRASSAALKLIASKARSSPLSLGQMLVNAKNKFSGVSKMLQKRKQQQQEEDPSPTAAATVGITPSRQGRNLNPRLFPDQFSNTELLLSENNNNSNNNDVSSLSPLLLSAGSAGGSPSSPTARDPLQNSTMPQRRVAFSASPTRPAFGGSRKLTAKNLLALRSALADSPRDSPARRSFKQPKPRDVRTDSSSPSDDDDDDSLDLSAFLGGTGGKNKSNENEIIKKKKRIDTLGPFQAALLAHQEQQKNYKPPLTEEEQKEKMEKDSKFAQQALGGRAVTSLGSSFLQPASSPEGGDEQKSSSTALLYALDDSEPEKQQKKRSKSRDRGDGQNDDQDDDPADSILRKWASAGYVQDQQNIAVAKRPFDRGLMDLILGAKDATAARQLILEHQK